MANYTINNAAQKRLKIIAIWFLCICVVGVITAVIVVRRHYEKSLLPVSSVQRSQQFNVEAGESMQDIASNLEEQGLIRSTWAFEWYIRSNDLSQNLLAGTYSLRPNMSISEIVDFLTQGKISTDLVTILPGQRIDQIHQALLSYGFTKTDVEQALDPETYKGHPALLDKPAGANLEGYLYPESFQKDSQTTAQEVVRLSLDQLQLHLTPKLREGIIRQGLTVHEGIILASIIEQEVSDPDDKHTVAQVFLKRLNEGMKLQSDPTSVYGAIVDGVELPNDSAEATSKAIRYESRYNTYFIEALPPTPISNVSVASLEAVANPSKTDFLYFVAGTESGTTHFSKTLEEHEKNVNRFCGAPCGN